MGLLLKVRIRVCRQPISSTVPSSSLSGERIQSPTLNGRSKYTINPPKKLDNKSFAANPTAIPPMPPNASTPEILNPRVCNITNAVVMNIEARTNFANALVVVKSTGLPFSRCRLI